MPSRKPVPAIASRLPGPGQPLRWLALWRRLLPALLIWAWTAPAQAQDVMGATTGIRGAGSTFAYPIISRWSRDYRDVQAGVSSFPAANGGLDDPPATSALEYEPVGSLAGMLRLKAAAVDFAASDVPLPSPELTRLGLLQFPLVSGGIAVVFNLDGIGPGQLRLTGPLLADIFLGKVTNWSDPALKALNPTLRLPDAPIAVVHRSDGSGTTFNFTNYLGKVSPVWKERVGSDLLVAWPTGVGAKGGTGLAQAVRRTPNAIGYVEFSTAVAARLGSAQIRNSTGAFIVPSAASFQAASTGADWSRTPDFDLLLTEAPGAATYPIVATVFVLMPKDAPTAKLRATIDFFAWAIDQGAGRAASLGYVPLPAPLVAQVKAHWAKTISPGR